MTKVLTTHHHWDHADGNPGLLKALNESIPVYGHDERIPALSNKVNHNDNIQVVQILFFGNLIKLFTRKRFYKDWFGPKCEVSFHTMPHHWSHVLLRDSQTKRTNHAVCFHWRYTVFIRMWPIF